MKKKEKSRENDIAINQNGQSAMLQKIVRQTYGIVVVGIVFLIVFLGINLYSEQCRGEQLENTVYLNQYRLGSKNLTSAVQSYAVTGDKTFYDNYQKELNEDKNRDIAKEGLKKNHLKDNEWEELDNIASMSEGLVPLEEQAMEAVGKGDTKTAQEMVFGDEYQQTAAQISSVTDECIQNIQDRMHRKQNVLKIAMVISMLAFIIMFAVIVKQVKVIMRFSKKELLTPIVKVSELLTMLAHGNFQNKTDMVEDESEVGQMITAINFMNNNFTKMISEISNVLGEMGSGNYNVDLYEEYVGEFAAIKESMVKIIADTKNTLTTIKNASDEIGSGSEQLANAATDLAEGCTIQAEKITEVSHAIDEYGKDNGRKDKRS